MPIAPVRPPPTQVNIGKKGRSGGGGLGTIIGTGLGAAAGFVAGGPVGAVQGAGLGATVGGALGSVADAGKADTRQTINTEQGIALPQQTGNHSRLLEESLSALRTQSPQLRAAYTEPLATAYLMSISKQQGIA